MLNFIYYPVSFILWCWHELCGLVFGDASSLAWAAAIVLLVFTLRAILLKPAASALRSMRRMQRFAPEMRTIQQRYSGDRQRQAAEMQRLQREQGVNPVAGCLPMLLQVPVFFGLNHVLHGFAQYSNRPNYFFPVAGVHSYLGATAFGAHLNDAILNIGLFGGHAVTGAVWMWHVAPVAIPLMLAAALATHVNARLSLRRGPETGSRLMSAIGRWIAPAGVLVFGGALPIGLLLYWVSNNAWTLAQQHLVLDRLDRDHQKPEHVP